MPTKTNQLKRNNSTQTDGWIKNSSRLPTRELFPREQKTASFRVSGGKKTHFTGPGAVGRRAGREHLDNGKNAAQRTTL